MTPIVNIAFSGIKYSKVVHQVNKGGVKAWQIKGIFSQLCLLIYIYIYIYIYMGFMCARVFFFF